VTNQTRLERSFVPKAAIILFADTETPEGMGRMANALTTVKEFKDAGDDAVLIFDGAGTRWVPQLAEEDNKYHGMLEDIRGPDSRRVRVLRPRLRRQGQDPGGRDTAPRRVQGPPERP
jgi:zona occludens toxin (predicted ATPase)